MTIEEIKSDLFTDKPATTLYHYTSLDGLRGIIDSGAIWASEIRYVNDASEMQNMASILLFETNRRISKGTDNYKILEQFGRWLSNRLTDGHMLFVASFTENGNLLSQWRGYCPAGKGVSVGFDQEYIITCAKAQAFEIGKCIYNTKEKESIRGKVIDAIVALAESTGENNDPSKRHPTESYYGIFEACEDTLLRISSLIKHTSFEEEQEWRAISPIVKNYVKTPIQYREGVSMLVPYTNFDLSNSGHTKISIQGIYLGPTPNINLSMGSLSKYLSIRGVSPKDGIRYSDIPYRSW